MCLVGTIDLIECLPRAILAVDKQKWHPVLQILR